MVLWCVLNKVGSVDNSIEENSIFFEEIIFRFLKDWQILIDNFFPS